MENTYKIKKIGTVKAENGSFSIQLDKKYISGLTNIQGYSHLQIVWWGHMFDGDEYREHLVADKPYKKGPDKVGVFGTRSPVRPNPILMTTVYALKIDEKTGIIDVPYIDAEDGSPVLDIKPYHPIERVKECNSPDWCKHWPKWYEDSAHFDWQNEFNF